MQTINAFLCSAFATHGMVSRNRFMDGTTVATPDGTGVVVDSDHPSVRPWRVRLDVSGEEMWYKNHEVGKTSNESN
jgi:hypothetical protein